MGDLNLDGFEHIEQLSVEDGSSQLTSIGANSLESAQDMYFANATILSSMSFPKLSSVDELVLLHLPALSDLSFTTGVKPNTIIIGNTFLSSLDGLSPDGKLDQVNVRYNPYLQDMTLTATSAGPVTIYANGDNAHISFPNLDNAESIEIGNASAIDLPFLTSITWGRLVVYNGQLKTLNLPSLQHVEDGLYLYGLPNLSTLSLPALVSVNSTFQMVTTGLHNLTLNALERVAGSLWLEGRFETVSLPALKHVGGALQITDSALQNLSLDTLERVSSSLLLEGPFESVSFPKLKHVGGALSLRSTRDFDCAAFSALYADLVEHDYLFSCIANAEEYDSETETHTAASSSAASASVKPTATAASPSGAATAAAVATGASVASRFGVGIEAIGGVFGVVSLLLFLERF